MAEAKKTTAADQPSRPAGAPAGVSVDSGTTVVGITAGERPDPAEQDLRGQLNALDNENRALREQVKQLGGQPAGKYEPSFTMSEGVRQDLLLQKTQVDNGTVKPENVRVVDPATGKVFGLEDLPAADRR